MSAVTGRRKPQDACEGPAGSGSASFLPPDPSWGGTGRGRIKSPEHPRRAGSPAVHVTTSGCFPGERKGLCYVSRLSGLTEPSY